MQKLVILLSCLVCLAAAGRLGLERKPSWWQRVVGHEQEPTKWEISEKDVHERQKFLLDVLLQVQNPVVNKELIEMGKVLINDPAAYREPRDELLWEFLELCREREVLGRTEIYTDTKIEHVRQLVGLTKFLTLAKDWPTFQRNVCFARLHINPTIFVNALLMAVHEREDTRSLVMPAMHEILPQLFYDKDVILTAENVEWLDLVSKTTTTKPSLLNIIGLGNMLRMISPIHWIRNGRTDLWRPWHERHWSPIEARRIEAQTEVEMKEPIVGKMIVGSRGEPIIAPIEVTWRSPLETTVAEDKIDETKILRQSEEKLIIPVEQQNSLSYLTDDVGLNIFWNHAMNQRLVETVTGDKHPKLRRLGVEKTKPWERQWKNQGRWERVERRDDKWQPRDWVRQETRDEGKWERVGDMDEDRRHTEWHPVMTKAERQQWRNEKLIAAERDERKEHEWTKADWRQDDDIPKVKRVGQKWRLPEEENDEDRIRGERIRGRDTEETENKRLYVNRRRQNWQRPSWWHKRQNMPETSEKTEKRWSSHVPEVEDEEEQPRIHGRWSHIRNGRVVATEESLPWTTDRLDRKHADDWISGEQKPNRREHVRRRDDDEERWNRRNGWFADIEKMQWESRDQPWRRDDEIEGKNWWKQEQRKVNDDDWRMPRTNKDDDWVKIQRTERVPSMRRTDVDDVEVDDKDWQDRRIIDVDRLMSRNTKDDDWVNSQRRPIVVDREDDEVSKRWDDRRRNVVDREDDEVDRKWEDRRPIDVDREDVEVSKRWDDRRRNVVDREDDEVDRKWEDRRPIDVDREDVKVSKRWDDRRRNVVDREDVKVDRKWEDRRPIDVDREDVEVRKRWDDRRRNVVDREDVKVDRKWEDRRPIDDDRWMSRITNDDDWVTPKHERNIADDDKETRHPRITRSIKTVDISPAQELMNVRSGEMFIQNMQQLMARINMEKISLAQTMETKPVVEPIWRKLQLMTPSGKLYQQMMVSPAEAHIKVEQSIWKLKHIIDNELEHVQMRPNNPDIVKMIGEILIQANGEFGNVWDELYHDINMAVYGLERSEDQATVLSVPSSNLREPIYQDILTGLNELIWRYKQQLQPYRREQLLVPGIHVDHVEVDDLVTYFDVTDGDLINLVDQQLLESNVNNLQKLEKLLVARQQRLNHKQFTLGYDITAEQPQRVVVRTFLGPKVDEHGRPMPLEVARQHYMLLDAFVENLIPGGNHIERNSRDIVWTTRDTSSLSEIYRRVMQGMPMHELVSSNCRYPHRLLLPRGTPSGLPMQLLIVVTPVREEDRVLQELVNPECLCGLGIAAMHLDTLPLDFPLDRSIENVVDFLQPNMLLKDVWIKHDERVEVPRV